MDTSKLGNYDVIWRAPSKDETGQMPLGNGTIAAGVYAIEDDALYLLLSRNDAFTGHGDLFKTGRVKVSINPNPFTANRPFLQKTDMATGSVRIEADGITIRIWADANNSVYHVELRSREPITVRVEPEFWDRFESCPSNQFDGTGGNARPEPTAPPVQDVRVERKDRILWYYAVGEKSDFASDMEYYGVSGIDHPDPYRHNTFGNLIESPQLGLKNAALTGTASVFDIRIHSLALHTPEPEIWMDRIEAQADSGIDGEKDWDAHCTWWTEFWNRGWIFLSESNRVSGAAPALGGEGYKKRRRDRDSAALVTQSYLFFRYFMACQSRGRIPTKFNGGILTQPLRCNRISKWRKTISGKRGPHLISHEDDRDWGRRFTFQNQRLLYWPLLASGDPDLMKPFFRYYADMLPVRKAITKAWFGHDGAYYRENIEPTGAERDCGQDGKPPKSGSYADSSERYFHSFYFTCGLEATAMMIDYYCFTGDKEHRDTVLLPFAREILAFYDLHYPRDATGMLRLDPAVVLETWWRAVNPTPDIAGLLFCLDWLIALAIGNDEDQTRWKRFRKEVLPIPTRKHRNGDSIAPAYEYTDLRNKENGELYPAFPFRRFGVVKETGDIIERTMRRRTGKNSYKGKAWTQEEIHWACAGNAKKARNGLIRRFRHASTQCRFPVYGSQYPDSCPDFNHFGSGAIALQHMLIQTDGDKIVLFPAWAKSWDAEFRLHAPGNTTVDVVLRNGEVTHLKVFPEERRKDVTIHEPL